MAEPALSHRGPVEPRGAGLQLVAETPAASLPDTTPELRIPSYELAAALVLERELGVSHALAQTLVRRGFGEVEAARELLEPTERHEPAAFGGIARALEVIEGHVRAGGLITVHGDYDVDGVCATAILVRALRALGADVGWFIPGRIEHGYGLSVDTVERLGGRGTALLVTVDCAITAVDEIAAARSSGIDVVVTDHHAPRADGELPDCPIIHPAICGYPCPDLCGAAVAYKLALALGADTADDDIELVALATVADLMPLRGENRRLVREGLVALARTTKPGLRSLMTVSRTDPSALDAGALGFRLAPRINAAGRLRHADAGLELLLTDDERRADEIANELDAVNAERRAVEQQILWQAEARVTELGDRPAYVLAAEEWHPGVIGVVASRIVERHHRPAILIALDGELGSGSGRSIPGFDLLGALHAAASHLESYGGHRAAAGLTVRRECLPGFSAAVEGHALEVLTPDLLRPVERIDAIVSGSELGLPLAEELEILEPCGVGNPRPRLLVPGARFGDLRPMGEGRHARFSVSSGGTRARAVAFGCDGRLPAGVSEPVDATFRLERNVWNGAVEPRLVLGHARPCAPGRIEVLGEPEDYVTGMIGELDADPTELAARFRGGEQGMEPFVSSARTVLDRRGHSLLAVLADAVAAGGPVLAVCADVPRRLAGLNARSGGFALVSYPALERDEAIAGPFTQLVALDPPAGGEAASVLRSPARDAGSAFTYLAWGDQELRFAKQMHELEYGLRASLEALYRSLRLRGRVAGEELERLLRGDGPHGRPARLAGRLIRVLAELGLVSLDRDLPALAIVGAAQTALESSPSYRAYARRYEDGRRFLSSANLQPSG